MGVGACSPAPASTDPNLAGFCDRALETVRLSYLATHYEGTDQDELSELMSQSAEASGRLYSGSAPEEVSDEWHIVQEYGSGSVSAETYLEADLAVRQYAAKNCDGLTISNTGVVELDPSA